MKIFKPLSLIILGGASVAAEMFGMPRSMKTELRLIGGSRQDPPQNWMVPSFNHHIVRRSADPEKKPDGKRMYIKKYTDKTHKNHEKDLKRIHRNRRHAPQDERAIIPRFGENLIPELDFGAILERLINFSTPNSRGRLLNLWKRIRGLLIRSEGTSGTTTTSNINTERADELTKILFNQLFKQFDLAGVLRKRADKLRRRMGSGTPETSSTTETPKTSSTASSSSDDGVRVVSFRRKDGQPEGMVTDSDKKIAETEKIKVESVNGPTLSSSTTLPPSSTTTTRYPQISLFQRVKGPIKVAVKIPQKHIKAGAKKRFEPAQGRDDIDM